MPVTGDPLYGWPPPKSSAPPDSADEPPVVATSGLTAADNVVTGDGYPSDPVAAGEPDIAVDDGGEFERDESDFEGAVPIDDGPATWRQLPEGRWAVGDIGRQPEIVAVPNLLSSRSDFVIDGGKIGELQFRAASVRGLSHQAQAKPRQDAYGFRITRDGTWFVGCVADGVSEGRRPEIAADTACRETTAALAEALEECGLPNGDSEWKGLVDQLPWQAATDRATDAIIQAATNHIRATLERQGDTKRVAELDSSGGLPPRAAARVMATTAIVLVIATRPNQNRLVPFAVAECAGDSSALLLAEGSWYPLTAVKNADNEVACSAVRPLPGPTAVVPSSDWMRPGESVVLITDGLGDPLGSGTGVVGRFLAESWAAPPDPLAFANHVAFFRKSFMDDRTALMVWDVPA